MEVWKAWKLQMTASPGATVTVAGEKAFAGPTWTVWSARSKAVGERDARSVAKSAVLPNVSIRKVIAVTIHRLPRRRRFFRKALETGNENRGPRGPRRIGIERFVD